MLFDFIIDNAIRKYFGFSLLNNSRNFTFQEVIDRVSYDKTVPAIYGASERRCFYFYETLYGTYNESTF